MSSSDSADTSRSISASPASFDSPSPPLPAFPNQNRPQQFVSRPQRLESLQESPQDQSQRSQTQDRENEERYSANFYPRHTQRPEADAEIRGREGTAMDRKRRLTHSTNEDEGRRRTSFADFQGVNPSEPSNLNNESNIPVSQTGRGFNAESAIPHNIVDLTTIPSPPRRPSIRHQRPSRTSSNSSRRYMVPPWQPDSEVSECPICHRQFTWLFRRHHCRKCGRVVCNDCSPHRITIPRQFIVNPPGPDLVSSATHSSNNRSADFIDLTGENGEDDVHNRHSHSRDGRSNIINLLEGGEKVRLCNPCVPDPQPEPPPNYAQFTTPVNTRFATVNPVRGILNPFQKPLPGPSVNRSFMSLPRPDDPFSTLSRPQPQLSSTLPRHLGLPDRFDPRIRSLPFSSHQDLDPSSPRSLRPDVPLPIPNSSIFRSPPHAHGRYHSLGSGPALLPPGSRPRNRSMLEGNPPFSGGIQGLHSSQPSGGSSSRPRLHERDICPVCRRALPARGENGDETAREAHIVACINARDPSLQTPNQHNSSTPVIVYMVPFIATEKDCIGADGNRQECSICMVEYDVGEELARLECLCKFHRECIKQWLARKQECPVHKLRHVGMSS